MNFSAFEKKESVKSFRNRLGGRKKIGAVASHEERTNLG